MNKFQCDICNKQHSFYGSINIIEPELLTNMSEKEKEKRVERFDSTYDSFLLVDKSFILTKGDLFIKIKNEEEYMNWKIWIKLIPKLFFDMLENLDIRPSTVKGEIFSKIP